MMTEMTGKKREEKLMTEMKEKKNKHKNPNRS